MAGTQIEGAPGRAENVYGEKDATELPAQNMGEGENTAVALGWMEKNKAAFAFDHGSPESTLLPLVGYPGPNPPNKPKDKSIET